MERIRAHSFIFFSFILFGISLPIDEFSQIIVYVEGYIQINPLKFWIPEPCVVACSGTLRGEYSYCKTV